MARKIIDIGVEGNDGTGDSIRESFRKTNENFQELYAVFGQGGRIEFTDLDDTPDTLDDLEDRLLAVNSFGSGIDAKQLVGLGGVTITVTSDQIAIEDTVDRIEDDPAPKLSFDLNARTRLIGNLRDPDNISVAEFNSVYGTALTVDDFAITKGYADNRFVNVTGDTMTGALNVPVGATGSEVPRVEEVVTRGGSLANRTMTDPLFLSDHPGELSGLGAPIAPNDLQAATKFYVDQSSFTTTINLFVGLQGDDDQTLTPDGKEGRSKRYAFKTLAKACEKAEDLLYEAAFEPGPYRQPITYDDAEFISFVTNITTGASGTTRVFFRNNAGSPVDQGEGGNIDLIPGKIVTGRESGATGIIFVYYGPDGATDSDFFDLTRVEGTFKLNEQLEFGNPVKDLNIGIFIESGIYYEDFPIRIPPNVAIIGDEMRRTIIRPRDGVSRSRWADQLFFRNKTFDGLTIATGGVLEDTEYNLWFGRHYLQDPSKEMNTLIYNIREKYPNAAALLESNRALIADEVVLYVNNSYPGLVYDSAIFERDIGTVVDAIANDLRTGNIDKTLNAGERYFTDDDSVIAVNTYKSELLDGIGYIDTLAQQIITNTSISPKRGTETQTTGTVGEADAAIRISSQVDTIQAIIDKDNPVSVYNPPKNNKDMDVFLCADSTIIRQICCQGHGGFMMVLDPEKQILSKSPYCQQSSSFSQSLNKQRFAGGQYVDGFTGNLTATVDSKIDNFNVIVTNIPREPQVPTSFFINGLRYKIVDFFPDGTGFEDAAALLVANKLFLQEQVVGYISTTYPSPEYKAAKTRTEVGYIIDSVIFDLIYGGNMKSRDVAKRYYAGAVTDYPADQKSIVLDSYDYLKDIMLDIVQNETVIPTQDTFSQLKNLVDPGESGSLTKIPDLMDIVIDVADNGLDDLPALSYAKFRLVLDEDTALVSSPTILKLLTAGNTSMLSNDYTQINDLGYGLIGINNALLEAVSVFTYYCHIGYYAKDGSQIRSLTGNNSYGNYGLVSEGSDVLEKPDPVTLADNMVQVSKVYRAGTVVAQSVENSVAVYIFRDLSDVNQFPPYNTSEIEINHGVGILKTVSLGALTVGSGYVDGTYSNVPLTGGLGFEAEARIIVSGGTVSSVVITKAGYGYAEGDILSANNSDLGGTGSSFSVPVATVFDPAIARYEIANIDDISNGEGFPDGTILKLNLASDSGLIANCDHDQPVTIRTNQNFKFADVEQVSPTRPSTALTFKGDPGDPEEPVYRVIAYGLTDPLGERLASDEAVLTLDTTYDFVRLLVDVDNVSNPDPLNPGQTLGGTVGDTRIAVERLTDERTRIETGQMIFALNGRIHRVVDYEEDSAYGIVTIVETASDSSQLSDITGSVTPGITESLDPTTNRKFIAGAIPLLRCGLEKGEPAEIIVRISTCRATSHDFLDIGTGGYNSSNYPSKIYGDPAVSAVEANQVDERTRGRVFYASTDQDGFFRVGRFFSVDQGTGRVSFAASIVLSNLDGLGFKRGVPISEFSNDDTFTQPANDTVPTEQAIHGYINRRLGLSSESGTSSASTSVELVNRVGPGFMDLAGINVALADLNIGGFKLLNLDTPESDTDAANKLYVDTQVARFDTLAELRDTSIVSVTTDDMLIYDGSSWINAQPVGDVTFSSASGTLNASISSNVIVNDDVNTNAAIEQSKLDLNAASTRADAAGITQDDLGVASFNSSQFDTTDGWVDLKSSTDSVTGVTLDKIQFIDSNSIVGNITGSSAAPVEIPASSVVAAGGGVSGANLTSDGLVTVDYDGSDFSNNVYSVTAINTEAAFNTVPKSDANGFIDVFGIKLSNNDALTISGTTIQFKTPGGVTALQSAGDFLDPDNAVNEMTGSLTINGSISTSGANTSITAVGEVSGSDGRFTTAVITPILTTGDESDTGTVIGNWSLSATSRFQATYADLAEYYEGDREYEPGTVLIFGGDREVTTTNLFGDRRVAGIVSDTAAYIMNKDCPGIKICLALQGRLKVKVVGTVKKGDILVTSAKPGYAVVNNDPKMGTILGKAIANKEDHNEGTVEVAVGRL